MYTFIQALAATFTIIGIAYIALHVYEESAAFNAQITPEVRATLDARSAALYTAPLRTLVVYEEPHHYYNGTMLGVLGAHDKNKKNRMRILYPCKYPAAETWQDTASDRFLIGVSRIITPDSVDYAERAMDCFGLLPVDNYASRSRESYAK